MQRKVMMTIAVACLSILPIQVFGGAISWESAYDYPIANPTGKQVEVSMAVSPVNSNIVIAGVMDIPSNNCKIYRSTDGGQNWSKVYDIPLTSGSNVGEDPTVTVDENGKFYVACTSRDSTDNDPSDIVLASSTNGGATWTTTTAVHEFDWQDKPFIVADTSAKSNNVYLCWSAITSTTNSIMFQKIVPNNSTTRTTLASSNQPNVVHACSLAVDSNGGIYATWMRFLSSTSGREEIKRNFNLGNPSSWTTVSNFGSFSRFPSCTGWAFGCVDGFVEGAGGGPTKIRVHNWPSIAIYSGNRVHVVYATYDSTAKGEIRYTKSDNCGKGGSCTWSSPITINRDTSNRDQWEPIIVASKKTSTVHVSAYDRRDDSSNQFYRPYHYHCHIADGCTLQTSWYNVQISGQGSTNLDGTPFIGDYHGIASSSAREAYAAWTDHRETMRDNYDIYGDRTTT